LLSVEESTEVATADDAFVLAVHDRAALRQVVSALPRLGASRTIVCLLTAAAGRAPTVVPRPEWPPVASMTAETSETDDTAWAVVRFRRPAAVRSVLVEFARCSANQRLLSTGWPRLGVSLGTPRLWPPAEPAAVVFAQTPPASDAYGPPDLIVCDDGEDEGSVGAAATEPHPVTGRHAVTVVTAPDLSWEQLAEVTEAAALTSLHKAGPASLGPVDDKIFNPIGFRRTHSGEMAALRSSAQRRDLLTFESAGAICTVDAARGLTEGDVSSLRDLQGVSLDWTGGRGPQSYCRVVASLAMAGIPLAAEPPPEWSRLLLGHRLLTTLGQGCDLEDPLAREERSIELRRAALADHAAGAWRQGLAEEHGLQVTRAPLVSVLLCTRRPDKLQFALRQVARQRNADIELVVAAHGFDLTEDYLSKLLPPDPPRTALSVPASVPFGDVLNKAASSASGDVFLKMDDDDWYGPNFISDLQLARMYSGADLVGCPPEFTFLEQLWLTAKDKSVTEVYRNFVAGGTIMVDRAVFRAVGGFRSLRKHVDASLLSAVAEAGGTIYRSHGLGFVLRRSAAGHAWDPGVAYFLARSRVSQQWRGFHPSRLLELDDSDAPQRAKHGY
jgi:hypothetical protein